MSGQWKTNEGCPETSREHSRPQDAGPGDVWERPLYNAVIELTNRCNLRCRHCASDSGRTRPGELGKERMLAIVGELARLGCREVTLLGGEIFLRDDWFEIAAEVVNRNMRLIVISNGLLVDGEIYEKLASLGVYLVGISIDGASRDEYRDIRGVDGFDRVLALLDRMVGDPRFNNVNAITTFTTANLRSWDTFADIFDGTDVTWQVQLANKGGSRFDEELFISRDDFHWFCLKARDTLESRPGLRLKFMDDFGYFPLDPGLAFLHETWHGCIAGRELVGIRSDGKVCACLSLGEKFMEADLGKESLADIWRSNRYFRAFRTRERNLTGACARCGFADTCGGGCAAMALSSSGSLAENRYCLRQLEEESLVSKLWAARDE